VVTIVSGASNPHTFEITPETILKASRARLLVLNGIGLEFWAQKLIDTIGKANLQVVETAKDLDILQDPDHAAGNPHVWLAPALAMHQVESIREALIGVDPEHASIYRRNSQSYLDSLRELDNEITLRIAGWQKRSFICFHPSWNYFANNYKLDQAAVIEKQPGFEPTPSEMMEIVETAKRLNISAIFAEKQFPLKSSETIARECGARVIILDPLGSDAPDFSYVKLMRQNVTQMALALE
jgi:ABC-type Zn uptake system ZnuABC Zn-binding protein ZnuA